MIRYIIKRVIMIIPVILVVAFMIFTLMYFVPGDPAATMLGMNSTAEARMELNEQMGLNDPYIVQLGRFMKGTFINFDLGTSYISKASVAAEIGSRLPYTLKLCYIGILLSVMIGVPVGILAAVYHNSWIDNLSMFTVIFGVSMPNFWFALVMIMWLALGAHLLPVTGVKDWTGYVIPCVSIAIGSVAMLARQTRSSMLESLRQDYIVTAKAKGQLKWKIVFKHAFRNALIPVLTSIGFLMASLLGATVVVESIFSIPGLGSYLITGINNRDYPVVRGTVLVLAIVFTVMMLVTDLLYVVVDPRLKNNYETVKSIRRSSKVKKES